MNENGTENARSPASESGRVDTGVQTRDDDRAHGATGGIADQTRSAADELASSGSEAASRAYDEGKGYAGQLRERYAQAQQYYEEGARSVSHRVTEAPLRTILAVAAVGYALGWAIHGGQRISRPSMASRSRTRRDLPGQRTGKALIESDRVEGTAVYDLGGNRTGTIKRLMIEKIGGRVARGHVPPIFFA